MGESNPLFPVFFDPADAVSDPKKVRILGNPTRFSLFFERKKGAKESSLFVNKSERTSNQETTLGLAAGNFAITIH